MTRDILGDQNSEAPSGKLLKAHYALLGAVCALVIGVYAWSAKSGFLELWVSQANKNYYNLLVGGGRAGQLNLKREVPPELAQLRDSHDPLANSPDLLARTQLLDLSHYKNKLYFYFGVTPALVLFWPHVVLTDHYLPHQQAVVILFSVGFLASAGLLLSVWRRYFGHVSVWVVATGALGLGLANFTLACLPRSGVYEVAISCGYALTALTLMLVWRAMHTTHGRACWLAAASLTYGLAVGARPSLLFGAVMLLVPVVMAWQQMAEPDDRPQVRTLFLAASGPITVIGLGLLLYNFLRFDNPLEFGHKYALSWGGQHMVQSQVGIQPFHLHFLWFNFKVYFLELARWSSRFPFVLDIRSPSLPPGHVGIEHVFGIIPNVPLVWFVLAAPLAWRGRLGEPRLALRWFAVMLVLLFGICALTLGLFFAACLRYQVDFLPTLVLLAVTGILGLERALAGQGVWQVAARWAWGPLLFFSVAFNLFAMFGLSSENYVFRGVIANDRGRLDEAITHFRKALAQQPNNAEAHTSLGTALLIQGRVPEGIIHLEEALRLKPNYAEAHNNLGTALVQSGRLIVGIGHYEEALRLKPDYAEAHGNLGVALRQQGKLTEAIGHYEEALRLKPDYPEAHNSLGVALRQQGKLAEAIGHYEEALRLKPDYPEAHYNLGVALRQQGKLTEAIGQYEEALRVKPDYPEAHYNLGVALRQQGKLAEAIGHYEEALRLKPDYPEAHNNLGAAQCQLGKVTEAIGHYKEALRLKPGFAEAQDALAWLLATCASGAVRNGVWAVELAEQANRRSGGKDVGILDTLAAAYAEAGRFGDAVRTAQAAVKLAKEAGQPEMARQIEDRLKLYQAGRPYRQE